MKKLKAARGTQFYHFCSACGKVLKKEDKLEDLKKIAERDCEGLTVDDVPMAMCSDCTMRPRRAVDCAQRFRAAEKNTDGAQRLARSASAQRSKSHM